MSAGRTKRRSTRQSVGRKPRSVYYESDVDEQPDFEASDGEQDFELEPARSVKKQKIDRRSKRQTRSSVPSRQERSEYGKRGGRPEGPRKKRPFSKQLAKSIKRTEKVEPRFTGPSDGRIPAWTTLPLEILRDIFIFASNPIHEQTTTATANATWLMRSARTNRALVVPALEAYYQSPPLLTSLQPHHLLELVQMPKDKTYINYKVKVRRLRIDVNRLAYAATGKQRLDLSALVLELPRLQDLEIIHPIDSPPYRSLKSQRWTYPEDLFNVMEVSGAKLKSWRWSRDMVPRVEIRGIYDYMTAAHTSKAFEHLERLTVCGFGVNGDTEEPTPSSEDDSTLRLPKLATLSSSFPHLKDLSFISCGLVMDNFLEHIPKNLERLELSNCLEITSNMLETYLRSGGSHLRELVLNHNPALNLAFLPRLKLLCPRLEVLKMDLTYYSERINFNDAWTMYEQLLTEDELPTWPSTLRHLELVNLRKWTAGSAQNLFRSLVDDAKDLPELRHLTVRAHIDIPFRDRAGFRDQWIERLNRVYLRKEEVPFPYLGSLRQYRLYKKAQAEGRVVADPTDLNSDDENITRRRLSHVRVTPRKVPADVEAFENSGPSSKKLRARRSVRVAELVESQAASTAAEDEPSSSDSGSENAENDWRKRPEAFVQGLCQVVDIRIDNQRPRENQYTEAHFLDSEPDGDEDWHSGAELSDDGYAW